MTNVAQPIHAEWLSIVLMVRDRVCLCVATLADIGANQVAILQGCFDATMRQSSARKSLSPRQRIGAHTGATVRLVTTVIEVFGRFWNRATGTDAHSAGFLLAHRAGVVFIVLQCAGNGIGVVSRSVIAVIQSIDARFPRSQRLTTAVLLGNLLNGREFVCHAGIILNHIRFVKPPEFGLKPAVFA